MEQEQDKSEAPTSHKLMQARRKGQVARGTDLSFLVSLVALLVYVWIAGNHLLAALSAAMRDSFVGGAQLAGDRDAIFAAASVVTGPVEAAVTTFAIGLFSVVLLLELLQTGFVLSSDPLGFDLSRLNPGQGLKRVFSVRMLVETGKNLLKFALYATAAWLLARNFTRSEVASISDAGGLSRALAHSSLRLIEVFAGLALFFTVVDQLITRKGFLKRMRMSRRELKREIRDREGDARLKQKRKQMHSEFVRNSRSLRGMRDADMLIVNPRHVAVALRYDPKTMSAPVVVATGVNQLALRLKRTAFIYNVPIIEDRILARTLLRSAPVGHPIPTASFRPVANLYNMLRRQRGS